MKEGFQDNILHKFEGIHHKGFVSAFEDLLTLLAGYFDALKVMWHLTFTFKKLLG